MKKLVGKGVLILGLVLVILNMPTTALGSEAHSQPDHLENQFLPGLKVLICSVPIS